LFERLAFKVEISLISDLSFSKEPILSSQDLFIKAGVPGLPVAV
jgi:hypothetical protein